MTYPVKIEFKEYPSGSWQDWSAYLVRPPEVKARVESENEGEAGIIVFDSASVSFRYESGNPVYAAFNIDLTDVQRYVFKISFPKSDKTYVQRYEGMADFSSIKWNEHNNVISFNIADKLTALGILSAVPGRTAVSVKNRVKAQLPGTTFIDFIFNNVADEVWIAAGHPEIYESFSSIVVNPGEVIKVPEWLDPPIGTEWTTNYRVVINSTLQSHPVWPGLLFNKIKFLTPNSQAYYNDYRYENEAMDDIECLDKNLYGVDINNISGGVLQSLKGVETLFALYKQAWPDATLVKKPSSFTFNIPSGYALRFNDETPLGGTPLDAVKTLANSMKLYVYVDRNGNFVIHSKNDLDFAGTVRTLGTTKVITRKKKYFWNKLADGATVTVKSWLQDETGEFIEGIASKTKQVPGSTAFIKPKNEISKELLTSDPNDTTVELLNARAETEANNILNFYGLRHAAYDLVLDLDDNTIYWELVDLLTLLSEDFFFTSLTFEPVERTVTLEPVETEGHDFDLRQIVVALSEESTSSGLSSTTNYNTGGGSGINYLFQNPLLLTGSQVSLQKTANLKVTSNQLDTVQDIQTSSTLTFNQLNLTTPGTIGQAVRADRSILTAAPLSGGGNLTADRTLALSYNATNLKLTSDALNTIQDIATTSSPQFTNLTITGRNVIGGVLANGFGYNNILTIHPTTSPEWIKIITNIPFQSSNNMPRIDISGYAYGRIMPANFSICWYIYNGNFINHSISSIANTWFPEVVKLGKDTNNKVVIVFKNGGGYYPWFYVSAQEKMGTNYQHYEGWSYVLEDITTETNVVTLPFNNSILTGNVGIGTSTPLSKLDVRGEVNIWGNLKFKNTGTYSIATLDGNLLFSPNNGYLKFAPSGSDKNILLGDSWLKREGFVSQLSKWAISEAGEADFRYLYTDELHAKTFIADLEQALAGSQIICKSVAFVGADYTLPSAGNSSRLIVQSFAGFENAAVFQNSDLVRLRQFSRTSGSLTIADAWGTVVLDTTYGVNGFDTATKTQAFTYTRHAAVPGNASGTVKEGTLALDYGVSGNGFIESNAIDGAWAQNSPYTQIVTWNTTPGNYTLHSRLGNLRGVTGIAGEYGIILGSGISNTDKYIRASSQAFQIHNIPFEIYDTSSLRASIELSGNMKLGTNVASAATTSFDFTSSSGALRLGLLAASKANMYFDGTNLAMRINTSERIVLDPVNDRLTIGDVSSMNTYITSSAIQLRIATTAKIQLNNDGSGFLASNIVNWNTSGVFNIGTFIVESDKIKFGTAATGFALNTTSTPFITGANSKGFEVYNFGINAKVFTGARDASGNLLKGFDWNITTADTLTLKGNILASKFSTKADFGYNYGEGVDIEQGSITIYRTISSRNYQNIINASSFNIKRSIGYGYEDNLISLTGTIDGASIVLNNIVTLDSTGTYGNNLTTASGSLHIKPYTDLHLTPQTGNLYLTPIGDVIVDPTTNFVLPANTYDITLGKVDKKYLAIHAAELWIQQLVALNVMATIGGRVLVGQTNTLINNLGTSTTNLDVKYQFAGTLPIICYLEGFEGSTAKIEFIRIDTYVGAISGGYRYTITRNLDGTGANNWYVGDAVFNTGAAGAGFIDIYSIQSVRGASQAGPTMVGNIRNSTTYNDWSEAWAIGNLGGLYGQASGTFGVGLGKYTNGSAFLLADSTNGIQIKARSGGVDTTVAQWAMSGDITVGRSASSHTLISSTALQLKSGSAVRLNLSNDGSGYLANGNIAWTTAGVLSVAGWTIDAQKIYTGSGGVGGIYINNTNSGSGNIYSWATQLKGFAITWHNSNNAGHIVVGQVAATGSTLKTDYMGIQMMDHLGREHFALSALTTGTTRVVYNRIAGCYFDHESIRDIDYQAGVRGWKITSIGTAEFNDVTVRGTIYATLGTIGGWTITSQSIHATNIEIHSANKIIRMGSTLPSYNSGTGIWMGLNSGDYKMFLGNSAGNKLLWDGSALTIAGTIQAGNGLIGGWLIESTRIHATNIELDSTSKIIRMGSTLPSYNSGTGIWMGLHSGAYKMFLGNSAGNKLLWDGTDLTINGGVFAGSITSSATITGGTIRTASSGERIELGIISTLPTISLYSSSGNQAFIRSYDDGGSQKGLWVGSDITDNVDRSMFTCAKNSSTLQKNYSIGINNYYRLSFGLTTYGDTTVPLLSLYKRDGISGYTLFDVYDNGNAFVLGKIIQDDVVRPYVTVTNNSSSNVTIAMKVRKFNNTDTANNRHAIHWWISATQYGPPDKDIGTESGGGVAITYTKGNALDPESIDTKILNTSVSDSDETVELNFNGGLTDESLTFYLMVEVQGIVYASNQITVFYTKP